MTGPYDRVRNPYADGPNPDRYADLSDAQFVSRARARLADLAGPAPRDLEIGDVVEWGQNAQFKAYGQILEYDRGLAVATVRVMDLLDDGRLAPTNRKMPLDLKQPDMALRKSNRALAGLPAGETENEPGLHIAPGSDADFSAALAATRGEAPEGYTPPWKRDAERRSAEKAAKKAEFFADLAAEGDLD